MFGPYAMHYLIHYLGKKPHDRLHCLWWLHSYFHICCVLIGIAATVVDVDHLYLVKYGSQSVGCIVHSAGVGYKADLPRPCEVGFLLILLVETFSIYFLIIYFPDNQKLSSVQ